jgi:crossover junction endodeoxyribonuclease RusA
VTRGYTLPWPPSVNRYYRAVNGRNILSAEGRRYKTVAVAELLKQRAHWFENHFGNVSRIKITFRVTPPDRRKRDLSNLLKAIEDVMTHAGVWGDDSQIDHLTIIRLPPASDGIGSVHATVETIDGTV